MNLQLIFDIVQLALTAARNVVTGTAEKDLSLKEILVQIIQKGALAYQQHTGEALDPKLIQAEQPL